MADEERRDLMQEAVDPLAEERARGMEIPLAEEREIQAAVLAHQVFAAARELLANGMLQATGYRVLVKPLEVIITMDPAMAEQHPTLAESEFQVKSVNEREREERGENHGVVIHIGPVAFERLGGREAWCDEGDTVVFSRYAGTRVEHPPGSGVFYQLMNDEDIFGKVI